MTQPPNVFTPPAALSPAEFERQQKLILSMYQQERFGEMEQAARALTRQAPQAGQGWKALGLALRLLGRHEEALPAMQQAAKLMPGDPEAFNNLGILLKAGKQFDFAAACFEHALKVNANFLPALDNLIHVASLRDQPQERLQLLRRKLALVPTDSPTRDQINALEAAAQPPKTT